MLFESGAVRKRLGNPIEGSVGANSAMCLINFFVAAIGPLRASAQSVCEGDLGLWVIPRLLSGEWQHWQIDRQ
jgi:hypothetical protein